MEPGIGVDLVHSHNRIPVGVQRFIMDFESSLPRPDFLRSDHILDRYMQGRIESRKCRRVIAMSQFAKRVFLKQHAETPNLDILRNKLMVMYPNIIIPEADDALYGNLSDMPLLLTFIGAHFGRKGGCVALKIAEKAQQRGMPIHVNIISSLIVGDKVWTDPTETGFFESYFKLFELDNVTNLGAQPNDIARQVLRESHFLLLPTFEDTFGFTAIEAMAEHTPVIATDLCALPEFVKDDENGIMLPIETDEIGGWRSMGWEMRGERKYSQHFRDEIERLAEAALQRLEVYINAPESMKILRKNARRTAVKMFCARQASENWDKLYEQVVAEPIQSPAIADQTMG